MQTAFRSILAKAIEKPKDVAIIDDQRRWRYIDLIGGAAHLAEKLEATAASQNVGLLLPTGGAFPMSLLAIWLLGKTVVPVNYLLNERERQYIIDDSEIDTLITVGPMIEFLGGRPRGVKIIELDQFSFEGPPPLRWPPKPRLADTAAILYTSGTSGRPKGVMLTHGNLSSNVQNTMRHIGLTQANTFFGVLPQFHSFGLTALTLLPLCVGAKVVYTARFVPKKVIGLIRKHRADVLMAIPSMYNAIAAVRSATADDLSSVRIPISGAEPLPQGVFEKFRERFGISICEGYGLTETSPVVSANIPGKYTPRSVGRVIPECRVRVRDDKGKIRDVDEEGEIEIAGPNIMAGYFKLPDMTREVILPDGFFRTGDWGKIDPNGYLYITGRKKEMLIIAGENVFPREIEEVLNRHPSVQDSAVIGVKDDVRGELPLAFVEMAEGAEFDEGELRSYCRKHLPGFKVPREIRKIDALPRNPTGKILRRELQP